MEPSEALGTAAQVAVALAGFAGVVVAFRSGSVHQWQAIDKLRLRLLLNNSLVPLILCLLALFLVSVDPHQFWTWRVCSALALVLTISIGMVMSRGHASSLRESKFGRGSKVLFFSFSVFGVAAMILQIYNLAILNAFWPFYATVLFQLITGAVQFVRLILVQPEASQ
jgi:hypothetical protein